MSKGNVGVIANPSSGKDIRRLVARGSVFDNNEKINIVRRALLGLDAVGVERVLFMPDYFSIVPRALDGLGVHFAASPLPLAMHADQRDSRLAAELLAEAEVDCIITLGGDGTNRVVSQGCGRIPLVPISTGTNNVFPSLVEGTLAGLAAGLLATGVVGEEVVRTAKRLDVLVDGAVIDLALVDVAFSRERFIGSRAIWDPAAVRELVLAAAEPGCIGLSAIGAHLDPIARDAPEGLYLRLADPSAHGRPAETPKATVLAPIAPGLIAAVGVREFRRIAIGEEVALEEAAGSLALDGERELVLRPPKRASVRLSANGPRVLDIRGALGAAAARGAFVGPRFDKLSDQVL
jgi:hypothetical protein